MAAVPAGTSTAPDVDARHWLAKAPSNRWAPFDFCINTAARATGAMTARIPPRFDLYLEPFSRYEMKRFGKKIGELPADREYGKSWTQLFTPTWTKLGGEVVAENPMSYTKSADLYSGVSKVLAVKPDAVFAGGPSEATALIAKQARDSGLQRWFFVHGPGQIDGAHTGPGDETRRYDQRP